MIIYYSHSYNNGKDESRRLLEKAVEKYLLTGRAGAYAAGEAAAESARLVSSKQTTGEYGKPYIPGFAPFSVSHSGCTWAVLIADQAVVTEDFGTAQGRKTSCGLDIQYPRKVDALSVMKRFFAPEDAAHAGEFFRMWTRREALIKAAGTSVAGSDVPAVSEDEVRYGGILYRIADISVPGCRADAAICLPVEMADGVDLCPEMRDLDREDG